MEPIVYCHRADLTVCTRPDGWVNVRAPGESMGIALDPVVAAIWSAAEGRTAAEIAQATRVSTYLATCTLATLQRAGLLSGGASIAGEPPDGWVRPASTTTAIVIIHQHDQADLDACLASVREQEGAMPAQTLVLATTPVPPEKMPVRLVRCQPEALLPTLAGELDRVEALAILLLDSRFRLGPAELAQTLAMRGSIGAVAPRVMGQPWPAFVVTIGLWPQNPYAGHLDVGQFEQRWQPVPAVSLAAGLFRRPALAQVSLAAEAGDLDKAGAEWCQRARRQGYRFLAAHQALAYGPWPAPTEAAGKRPDRPSRHRKQLPAWQPPGPGPMLHDGFPALTLDNVRGIYSHSPAIAPLPIRRRIALLAEEPARHQAMIRELETVGQVHRLPPDGDEELLLEGCRAADLVIAGACTLDRCRFLEDWPRPLLLLDAESPEPWLGVVDGLVCDGGKQVRFLKTDISEPLIRFCRQPHLDPEREIDLVLGPNALPEPPPPTPARQLPLKAWQTLSRRGVRATAGEVAHYLRWKLGV